MTAPVIGFAGLTHLGIVSAVAAAAKGFSVVGYDADRAKVEGLRAGRMPIVEPGLDELARDNAVRLSYAVDIATLSRCDVVYIATDVPTDEHGTSDLAGISALIARVIPTLSPDAILVVLCQVPPGFTRQLPLAPERLYYQVETLVFGRAVERATQPERFIVGCADPVQPLPEPYGALLATFGCPLLPMRYESAELAKIAINCCLAASVTISNTLAELSERIGADWHEIVPALRLDRRIGPHAYLAPGLGIAGGNIERDLATVLRLATHVGSEASVVAAYLANSRHARDWVLRVLHRDVLVPGGDPVVAALGLAYKENTHSTKNSPALEVLRHLEDYRVRLYDPAVPASAVGHPRAEQATSALDAATGADVLLVLTPWPEFRAIDPAALAGAMRGRVIVDPYGVLTCPPGFTYFRIGSHA